MGMSRAARMMMFNRNGERSNEYAKHETKHHDEASNPHNEHGNKKLDRKAADEWVSKMESRDGTRGGKWTYDQTTQLMKQKAFDCDPVDFYIAMNSVWSDYGKTLSKYGLTAPEAFAELAYDWVKDPDAHEDKAARYYEYIVK